jgi:type II secretory pathway pseudopilin PulG
MKLSRSFRRSHSREQGYILMLILLLLALLLVSLVAIAPRMATEIKREREEEMVHRGKDYATAVKRYFKKFGRYPTSIEQLENTNNIRFLRRRWKDPTTGKDFRLLHFGEQKSVPKGLFGAAIGTGGALPGGGGGGGIPGAIINSALGGGPQGQPQSGQPGPSAGPGTQGDQGSQPGAPAASISSPLGTGQTFGGGPIIGVAGTKNQASLKTWNDKNNYKDWEFYYDPRFDVQQALTQGVQGVGLPGQAGTGPNPNPNRNPAGTGSMGPK